MSASDPPPPPAVLNLVRTFTDLPNGNLLCGTLDKCSPLPLGLVRLNRRYFRLSRLSLSYFSSVRVSSWGIIAIDELGSIPTRLITRLESNPDQSSPNSFTVWATNAENSRYPGMNHVVREPDYEIAYMLRAPDAATKTMWCDTLTDVLNGKYAKLGDSLKPRLVVSRKDAKTGEQLYKTNLGRLLMGGDDFDSLRPMPIEDMLQCRDLENKINAEARNKLYVRGGAAAAASSRGGRKEESNADGQPSVSVVDFDKAVLSSSSSSSSSVDDKTTVKAAPASAPAAHVPGQGNTNVSLEGEGGGPAGPKRHFTVVEAPGKKAAGKGAGKGSGAMGCGCNVA